MTDRSRVVRIIRAKGCRRRPGERGEKGPAARRRPKAGREAYFLYVDRPAEGANEADGPSSAREP